VDAVPITPQVFDLLDSLIRNRERVVSKEDLISAVWNGRIVSDAALTTRLNAAPHADLAVASLNSRSTVSPCS
jgi:DNA-binding winged helix-turn-helix (wHTH) protein